MEIIEYAPVIIPTLNRYEHFKRCLESLERCTGSEYTDVFIGLDYPPSEKYIDGWRKIDLYLSGKERESGFGKLHVIRRDYNCGVGHSGSNGSLLIQEISQKYDRYIFSEDDNEFSPNFLEYMNKGLELYKDNPRIVSISGYCYLFDIVDVKTNAYPACGYAAWGVGHWSYKPLKYKERGIKQNSKEILNSWKKSWKIFKTNPTWFNGIISMYFQNKGYGDNMWCVDSVLYGQVSIFPKVSKVRNWGNDGTGVHCKKIIGDIAKQEIDENLTFEYDDSIESQRPVIFSNYYHIEWYKWCGALARYFFYKLFGKDLFEFLKSIKGQRTAAIKK